VGCFDCKKVLGIGVDAALAPIRERAAALEAHPGSVVDALDLGAARARQIANATIEEVRAAMGIGRAALARFSK